MDRNTMKRKLAWMLCACVLLASAAPAALAESTPGEAQAVTLEEDGGAQVVKVEPTDNNTNMDSEGDSTPDAKAAGDTETSGNTGSTETGGGSTGGTETGGSTSGTEAGGGSTSGTEAGGGGTGNNGTGGNTPSASTPIDANASADIGKITVNITDADSSRGITVSLTKPDQSKETKTTTGKSTVTFENLSAGDYVVTVAYTDAAEGETAKTFNVTVSDKTDSGNTPSASTPISADFSKDVGKITVDIYGTDDSREMTITLTGPDQKTETRKQTGKGNVTFENLSAGEYVVTVAYTEPVEGETPKTFNVIVSDKTDPEPSQTKPIEATASVDGQSILVTITDADEDKTLNVVLTDADGKTTTGEIKGGQASFTKLAAGTYSVTIAYSDGPEGSKTISGLTVAEKSDAQAITATATAGVKRIDVDVTAASPLSVTVTLMQDGQPKDTRSIAAGVGKVSFENLAAGTYSVSINYAPAQSGVSATVIDNLVVAEQAVGIAIASVTPGENKLTVSGTAKPNARITLTTVPDGGSTIVTADASGKFSAALERTAGTYTAVNAEYVGEEASRVTFKGTFVVTGTATKPALDVDNIYNNSLTVVAKTTAGVTVHLKASDYAQTLVADSRGIVRFTLPHTYDQGTRFTLTVYYGAGNTLSYDVEVTVGGTPYYKLFKRGSRGDGVYALTSRLAELGYPVSATNYYNDTVVAAVRLFQSANGLSTDGMAGKLTQEKLFSVSAIGYNESHDTYPTLVRGDRGMALIYTLQQRLKDLGYYTIRVDGIFGSGTQRAVRWFQSVNGLSVTGKADNATQQLLYSSQAKAASGYSPDSYDTLSRSNRYNANVVPLQRRLKALGYLSGSADGYFGSNTYRAVRSFQSRNGLSVTGVADPGTQQLLYSSSARPAAGSSSSSSSSGYRLLYWGCKGDAVKKLQQALIDAGYKSYVRTADGIYGKWTYDAVRAYQKDVGLSVDGIAGKNTQNKLYGTSY